MMKAVIINCFDTYEERSDLVYDFFKENGYDVTVILSDFGHFNKIQRKEVKDDSIFIETKPYYKNLSFARLSSHYKFSKEAVKIVEHLKPDLLYIFVPPNSLSHFASKYKQIYNSTKLIFDLIDLWPETMPIVKGKGFFPFTIWSSLRDKGLDFADVVITECDLYKSVLNDIKSKTIYLAKKEIDVESTPQLAENEIHLAYLGSINNIIDIPKIKQIIEGIIEIKPVIVHIIGDGETKEEFIKELRLSGAQVKYYGKIYNAQKKQDIFDKCHFGLNIMKKTVCVGLTMKSVDYFQYGLPIINNIPADTEKIVEKYGVGINVSDELDEFMSEIVEINNNKIISMKKRALEVFQENFSVESFKNNMKVCVESESNEE